MLPALPEDILIVKQSLIGWNGVLEGDFSYAWGNAQQSYFERTHSRQTGFKWQVEVCRCIWMIRNDIQKETSVIDKRGGVGEW